MKSLEKIVEDLINNKEILISEKEFLKKNLMNESTLSLFSIMLEKCSDKIPSTCVSYMTNKESVENFKKIINIFKQENLTPGTNPIPLRKIKRGIFKNNLISAEDKAVLAFFSQISDYMIEGFSKEILNNMLNLQCEFPKIKIKDKLIHCASVGMIEKKIDGNSLSEFVHFLHDNEVFEYLLDKFLTDFSNSMEYLLPIMSSQSLSEVCKMSNKLYREYYNKNINNFHYMVKVKIKRLESLNLKIRKSISEELKNRPNSSLAYLLI